MSRVEHRCNAVTMMLLAAPVQITGRAGGGILECQEDLDETPHCQENVPTNFQGTQNTLERHGGKSPRDLFWPMRWLEMPNTTTKLKLERGVL